MRAMIEKMISPDYVLCYVPRALDLLREKMKILKLASKEVGVPVISVAAPLWCSKFSENN